MGGALCPCLGDRGKTASDAAPCAAIEEIPRAVPSSAGLECPINGELPDLLRNRFPQASSPANEGSAPVAKPNSNPEAEPPAKIAAAKAMEERETFLRNLEAAEDAARLEAKRARLEAENVRVRAAFAKLQNLTKGARVSFDEIVEVHELAELDMPEDNEMLVTPASSSSTGSPQQSILKGKQITSSSSWAVEARAQLDQDSDSDEVYEYDGSDDDVFFEECLLDLSAKPLYAGGCRLGHLESVNAWVITLANHPIRLAVTIFSLSAWVVPAILLGLPVVKRKDPKSRKYVDGVIGVWSKMTTWPFFKVKVKGRENLPPEDQAVVYAGNHQSFMDILSCYHLNKPFKWVSKASILKIPVIGWAMKRANTITIEREDRRSQMEAFRRCISTLQEGTSIFIFPEGTRSADGALLKFKKGPVSMAKRAKVPIIPVTILGTGRMMPSKKEYLLYHSRPGVEIIVHPPMSAQEVQDTPDADTLLKLRQTIESALPLQLQKGTVAS
ncbi:LPAT1 [Symbiodinium pilosum]|uniref:1-acyl-sn-glycerol-3-phosphate acyltransferase n=1 Tax=Symbiodinium pilosum TaxID=2952 RepID=A0A812UFY6_SYMPI|nr:LPAT1 [Symbiodinium pilosum]